MKLKVIKNPRPTADAPYLLATEDGQILQNVVRFSITFEAVALPKIDATILLDDGAEGGSLELEMEGEITTGTVTEGASRETL